MTTTRDVTRYQPPGALYVKRPAEAFSFASPSSFHSRSM